MALQGIFFSSPQLQKQYNAATSKQDQYKANGIMNNAFSDYPSERPHTPSFIGSYSSVYDPHLHQDVFNANRPPKASYLYKDTPVEPPYVYKSEAPRRPTTISTSASTVGFLPPKKKQRSICGKSCVLLLLLVCFIILSIVMIVLYAEKNEQGSEGKTNGNSQPMTGAPTTKQKLDCRPLPKPVAFNSLPANVLTELRSLETLINSTVVNEGPKAVSVNIVYMDKVIWQKEFGVMNNSETNKRKPTSRTIFPIASVSKVLTTLMLYKLYSQGIVRSLDDPVTNYQFDFSVKNPFNNAPITLRQLASHRSGLPREAPCFPDKKDNLCPYTQAQMIQRLKNTTLLKEPGKEPQYSNLGFALLGQVLGTRFSRIGGGFEEWMRDNLLSTLGMTDTTFPINLDASLKQSIPVGYLSKKGEFHRVLEWGWLNPGGGAFSTVADLAKLEIALFREGSSNRYLPRGYTDSFFAPGYILPDGKGDVVGTPWEMKILDDMVIREKRGYIYGYDSIVSILPEMKVAMNILCTNCRARQLASTVRSTFITKILPAFKEALNNVQIQKIVNPPDTKPFLGVFLVEGVPGINHMEAKIKDTHIHLFLNGINDLFILNYTQPETFKIIIPANFPCETTFTLGVNQDLVVYDSPSKVDGLSDRFTMYGAHPSGRTYFNRNRTSSST